MNGESAFERFRSGDGDAIEAVIGEFAPDLFPIAFGILGHSALAESAVLEGLAAALGEGEPPAEAGDLGRWLVELVRTQALALRAGTPKRTRKQERGPAGELPGTIRPGFLAGLSLDQIAAAFEALPPPQRRAVSMAYLHGLRTREAAKRAGVDEEHARAHLSAGLLALQDALAPVAELPL